jgi:hypothetical protein
MQPYNQANIVSQQFQGRSIPQSHQGIVSPCSSCLNQRATSDSIGGKPSCPRRVAAAAKQQLDNNSIDSSQYDLLVLTGSNPGEQDDGTKALSNPVYDSTTNTILVWSATFKDNGPTFADDGTVLSPDILDPNFSSDWIQCWQRPFTPRDPEATYFQKGCLMEGDQVDIIVNSAQQISTNSINGDSSPLPIDGTVNKVQSVGQYPLQPILKDLTISGT